MTKPDKKGCGVAIGVAVGSVWICAALLIVSYSPVLGGIFLLASAIVVCAIIVLVVRHRRSPQVLAIPVTKPRAHHEGIKCQWCSHPVDIAKHLICPNCGAPVQRPIGRRDNETFSV